VLSLAIGIGANATVYSVMNALFLRSLPVHEPRQLRVLNWTGGDDVPVESSSGYGTYQNGRQTSSSFSYATFREFQKRAEGFESVFAFCNIRMNAVASLRAWVSDGLAVSGNFFQGLGTEPVLGRTFDPADDRPGAAPVAVISYRLWGQEFGADRVALGSTITLNRVPYTIIGVLPPGFSGINPGELQDIFIPITRAEEASPYYRTGEPDNWWVQVGGRLKPGARDASAKAALNVILNQVVTAYASKQPKKFSVPSTILIDGRNGLAFVDRYNSRFLLILMSMVGLALLIACANVANLMLARASARSRELAIRVSLGAGRWRTIRHLLTEGLMIGLAGGLIGLAAASQGSQALMSLMSRSDRGPIDVAPDWRVTAFTFVVSLATAILFSLLPAWRATRIGAGFTLKHTGAGASAFRQRAAGTLIGAQVAISMVLVIGAGLFARTLVNITRVDLGFHPQNVLLFYVDGSRNGYKGKALSDLYGRIAERMQGLRVW
jgi:predicted permease